MEIKSDPQKDPVITSIMSMMLPGLGQLMKGHTIEGISWAFVVGFGYLSLISLGVVVHALCILDAAFNKKGFKTNPGPWWKKAILLLVVVLLVFYASYRSSVF